MPPSLTCSRRSRRNTFLRLLAGAVAAIAGVSFLAPLLTWNLTASEPRGLYLLLPGTARVGDYVTLAVPSPIAALVHARAYLPQHCRLLKRVVATAGDDVCIDAATYKVGSAVISTIAHADLSGRPLLPISFCGTVPPGCAFVASPPPSSLDSRYFGPVPLATLTRALPLWTY
jgi:conjugative transfer signal peptidase TraF